MDRFNKKMLKRMKFKNCDAHQFQSIYGTVIFEIKTQIIKGL